MSTPPDCKLLQGKARPTFQASAQPSFQALTQSSSSGCLDLCAELIHFLLENVTFLTFREDYESSWMSYTRKKEGGFQNR